MGKSEFRYEANADVGSLHDDYESFLAEAERAPHKIAFFIQDVAQDCRFLAVNIRVEARMAVRHVASLFHNATGPDEEASAANHT